MRAVVLWLALVPFAAAGQARAPTVEIAFVGDVMVAETPGELIARGQDPFAPFADWLRRADLRVGNLECVVATGGTPEPGKPYTFRADPRVLPLLKRHFDGMSVANNHSGDFGKAAFVEMLQLMRKAQLPYFGGGKDLHEAHAPWIVERNGLRIALLGYVEFKPRSFEAGAGRPGVAWSGEEEQVIEDIIAARSRHRADLVIPYLHWGWEDEQYTSERQRRFARAMIDAGADLVVGAHPHVTQGVELYKDRPIVYSLGNFLFNGFDTPATLTGWTLEATLDRAGVVDWRIRVARLDKDGVPHPDVLANAPCGKRGDTVVGECRGD